VRRGGAAMRTVTGVGDLVQRTGDGRTGQILGGWAVERSGGCDRTPSEMRGPSSKIWIG
jgi:hypothetical protein